MKNKTNKSKHIKLSQSLEGDSVYFLKKSTIDAVVWKDGEMTVHTRDAEVVIKATKDEADAAARSIFGQGCDQKQEAFVLSEDVKGAFASMGLLTQIQAQIAAEEDFISKERLAALAALKATTLASQEILLNALSDAERDFYNRVAVCIITGMRAGELSCK